MVSHALCVQEQADMEPSGDPNTEARGPDPTGRQGSPGLVHLMFLLSGACGLIYQVVWSRQLGHVFGVTVLAVSVVLAAFMSGLALGSHLLGSRADGAASPLRLYALCEIGVAASALLASLAMEQLAPIYVGLARMFSESRPVLHVARFSLAFALILIPTTLMGATLPILGRNAVRGLGHLGRRVSRLYAVNTAGAILGALAAGFWLVGRLGLRDTVWVAVIGNLAVGILSWTLAARLPLAPPSPSLAAAARVPPPRP